MSKNDIPPMSRRSGAKGDKLWYLLIFITAIGIFIYAFRPISVNDAFFGLKMGEYVIQNRQLPQQEPFSWSAQGRSIIPYEWLAQTFLYLLFALGGFTALKIYVAATASLFFMLVYFILTRTFGNHRFTAYALSLLATSLISEFFVARPHSIALISFILLLHLVLQSKFLWLTLPLTYVWTNSHASFIFVPFLFFSYALVRRSKKLALFGLLNLLVTLLPPLWYHPYSLIWHFIVHLPIITRFILEWGALSQDPTSQTIYTGLVATTLLICVFLSLKSRHLKRWLIALPLVIISVASLQAIRHLAFGATSTIFLLALFLPRRLFLVTYIFLLGFTLWLFASKIDPEQNAQYQFSHQNLLGNVAFLKSRQLQGHMFNEFALGSYLLYYLHPQYQVFFDGRADIYFCCEIPAYLNLIDAKHASEADFSSTIDRFLDKYQFSYLIIPYASHNPLEFTTATRMFNLLLDRPDWRLIYASDDLQILLKNDGKNSAIFTSGFTTITPYRSSEFRPGQAAQAAQAEYEQLIAIQNSGVAQSGLGFSLLAQNQPESAKIHFESAIKLNPYIGKPHLGLGKITNSTEHLQTAIKLSPHLGEAYLLLGKLKPQQARAILEQGLTQNIDLLSRQKIVQLLSQIP